MDLTHSLEQELEKYRNERRLMNGAELKANRMLQITLQEENTLMAKWTRVPV